MTAPTVYTGIKFPFQKGASSFPKQATNEEVIRDSLIQLVLTRVGERIMRPDCGSHATAFVFENNDMVLASTIRSELQGVVAKYEPRVQLTDVRVERSDATVIVTLVYVILVTGQLGSMALALPAM